MSALRRGTAEYRNDKKTIRRPGNWEGQEEQHKKAKHNWEFEGSGD